MQLSVGRVTAIYGRRYGSGNIVEIRGGKPENLVIKSGFYRIEPIDSNAEVTAVNASSSNIKVGDYVVYAKPDNFTHNVIIAKISDGVASNFVDIYPRGISDDIFPEERDSEPFSKIYRDTSFSLNEYGFEVRKSSSTGNLGLKIGDVGYYKSASSKLVKLYNNNSSIDIASGRIHFSTSALSEEVSDFSGKYVSFSVDSSETISLRSSVTTINSDNFLVDSESGHLILNSAVIDFVSDFTVRYGNVNVFSNEDGVYLVNPHKNEKKAFVVRIIENAELEESKYSPNSLLKGDFDDIENKKKFVIEISTNEIAIRDKEDNIIFSIFLEEDNSNNTPPRIVVDNKFLENLSDTLINRLHSRLQDLIRYFQTFLQSLTSDPYAAGAISSTLPNIVTLSTQVSSDGTKLNTDFENSALDNYRAKHVKALNDGQS